MFFKQFYNFIFSIDNNIELNQNSGSAAAAASVLTTLLSAALVVRSDSNIKEAMELFSLDVLGHRLISVASCPYRGTSSTGRQEQISDNSRE